MKFKWTYLSHGHAQMCTALRLCLMDLEGQRESIISHLTKMTLHFRKEMGMHFLHPLGFVLGLLGRDAVHLP